MDRTVNEMPSSEISRRQHWFNMPVSEQLLNVGSEVHRAIRWKILSSRSHLGARFRAATGMTLREYRNRYKKETFDEI